MKIIEFTFLLGKLLKNKRENEGQGLFMVNENIEKSTIQPQKEDLKGNKAFIKQVGNNYWICCGRCTHKLGKITKADEMIARSNFEIQIKCSSCKTINVVNCDTPVIYESQKQADLQAACDMDEDCNDN